MEDRYSHIVPAKTKHPKMNNPTCKPSKDPDATKYGVITYQECISQKLNVMDMTAFTLCMENTLPIVVFDMNKPGNLRRVVTGEKVGTLVRG